VDDWIRRHVEPSGPLELESDEPWGTVWRVPLGTGSAWLKACGPQCAFEPRLTAELFARWPDRVPVVLAYDEERRLLLLEDAGVPLGVYGNPPEAWLQALPPYAELQRGEAAHADDHVRHGVPDRRLAVLPECYERLVAGPLPLDADELVAARALAPRFAELCAELASHDVAETVQHDDLHFSNVYDLDGRLRVVDWGDACVAHPFFSLVVTFHFLRELTKLEPGDPWFGRLRDAYLEPWGPGYDETFELALRVGVVERAIAWGREREELPQERLERFDLSFAELLRHALFGGSPVTGR
jgi:hypothetical protein